MSKFTLGSTIAIALSKIKTIVLRLLRGWCCTSRFCWCSSRFAAYGCYLSIKIIFIPSGIIFSLGSLRISIVCFEQIEESDHFLLICWRMMILIFIGHTSSVGSIFLLFILYRKLNNN